MTSKWETLVRELFDNRGIESYHESVEQSYLSFEVRGDSDTAVTFDDLQILSSRLGTTKINLGTQTRDEGYCESCHSYYGVVTVNIEAIGIPHQD